jgi:protein-tyrosine-phosphatase
VNATAKRPPLVRKLTRPPAGAWSRGDGGWLAAAGVTQEFPKPLTDEFMRAADVVVTMGCGDACPIYPGKRYEDWELKDPAGQPVEVVRRIRDDIDARVQQLLAELVPSGA